MRIYLRFLSLQFFLFLVFNPLVLKASEPFQLMTVESTFLPSKTWTLGLMESGYRTPNLFINTNTIMDMGLAANIGLKYAHAFNQNWRITAGARYLRFFGESVAEKFVKNQNPNIESFEFDFNGYNAFVGASYAKSFYKLYFNTQYADVSGSKVLNLIFAMSLNLSSFWHLVLEGGYDLNNDQPRASLGVVRQAQNIGYRVGMTYVEVDDPSIKLRILPVLDIFWVFGDKIDE